MNRPPPQADGDGGAAVAAPNDPWRLAARIGLTLLLGAAGGALFDYFQLPLAWMIGAMCATTVASLFGGPVAMPPRIRGPMIAVLGVMLGSAFSPAIAGHAADWLPTMAGMAIYVTVVTVVLFIYFRRVWGYDAVTSYCSASPGGLTEMVIVGGAMGGDERTISLIHAARVLLVVLIVPFGFALFGGYDAGARPPLGPAIVDFPLAEVGILGACAVIGAAGAKALKIPAAFVTGPMVLSAAVHLTGLTTSRPPAELVAVAQVVIGCAVGCRFAGVAIRTVAHTLAVSLGSSVIMLGLTLLFALALAPIAEASFPGLVLALAPGGLAEMSLIALALGIDSAFVSTHHIFRIVLLVIVAPAVFRKAAKKLAPAPSDTKCG